MDLSDEHKKHIERKIMETIIESLENGKLTTEEYDQVAAFILQEIEPVKTHEDLLLFLRKLTHQWPVFAFVLSIENGMVKNYEDKEKIRDLLNETHALQSTPVADGAEDN